MIRIWELICGIFFNLIIQPVYMCLAVKVVFLQFLVFSQYLYCYNFTPIYIIYFVIYIIILYSLSKLTELSKLSLSINDFNKGVPSVIGELTTLKVLHLMECQLGDISERYAQCIYKFIYFTFFISATHVLTKNLWFL